MNQISKTVGNAMPDNVMAAAKYVQQQLDKVSVLTGKPTHAVHA